MADKAAAVSRSDFILKLHRLLSHPTHPQDLHWDDDECFRITCEDGRARDALKTAWTFTSLSTFVRQLNYYGFERQSDRRRTAERSGRSRHAGYILFKHPSGNFNRNVPELAERIQRRARKRAPQGTPGVPRANRLGRPIKEPKGKGAKVAFTGASIPISTLGKPGITIKTEDLARSPPSDPSLSSGSSSLSPPSPISPASAGYPMTPNDDVPIISSYPESPRLQLSSSFFPGSSSFSWPAPPQRSAPLAMHDGRQLLAPHSAPLDSGYFEDQPSQYSSPAESSSGLSPVYTPRYSPPAYHEPTLTSAPAYPYHPPHPPPVFYSTMPAIGRPSPQLVDHSMPREGPTFASDPSHQAPSWSNFSSAYAWQPTHDPRSAYRLKVESDSGYHRG